MAIFLTRQEIIDRFTDQAKCSISYKGHKNKVDGIVWQINWKQVAAITILFDEPHEYMIDGDVATRPGVRIVVKG